MKKETTPNQETRTEPTLEMSNFNILAYDPQKTKVVLGGIRIRGFSAYESVIINDTHVIVRLQATSLCVEELLGMLHKTDIPLVFNVHAGGDKYNDFTYFVKVDDMYPETLGACVPVIRIVLQKASPKLGHRYV